MKKIILISILLVGTSCSTKIAPKTVKLLPEADKLKCIQPTVETIQSGSYPLSRPLYLYINKESLKQPEIAEFLQFVMTDGQEIVAKQGFVSVDMKILQEDCKKLSDVLPSKPASNKIQIDGSSTLFPLLKHWAEEFRTNNPNVNIELGGSGTGSGFKKFLRKERQINAASRRITKSEKETAMKEKIEYIELRVALDGISIVVNPNNTWCNNLTMDQLKEIWKPNSEITHWSQINPNYPVEEIKLYGPDSESGTFSYFTEAVVGAEKACRTDYNPSTNDSILVQGVSGDEYSLGYFGYSYYIANKDKLKVLGIENR